MGQDATVTVLKTSVLGTFRIFVVMLAGFLASKLPRNEREYFALIANFSSSQSS